MSELYEDLLQDLSESFEDGNYFLLTITELELGTTYPLEFRWKYKDGTFGKDWSAVYNLSTPIRTVPNEPRLLVTDVVGEAGHIKINWSGNDASGNPLENIDRVDIHISGTSFGDGTKPAGFFKVAGTQTFAAEPGIYIVQLKTITVNGGSSFFSDARTVTVTALGEVIQSPTNPNGFTSKRILAGIEVSWAGTYSNSTFTGFEAIKIYAGTSASATVGTYTEVGVLTGNNVKNTIVIPVDGTYVAYGQATYIHAAAVNKNGTVGTIQANVTNQPLGPGKATDADINDGAVVISKLAADVLTVGNLKAGDINSTSFIRAGTSGSARVEISSSTVGSVLPGLTVYDSAGTQLLRAPLTGGLTINGGGTFSGNLSAAGGTFTGTLSAASGSFSGTITASGGTIGGITIASAALQNNSIESSSTFKLDSGGKARFGSFSGNAIIINPAANVGSAYIYHSDNGGSTASGKFTVRNDGVLIATGAQISGTITANALDTTSLDIASDGAITTSSGNFGVTSGGVLSATGATLTNGSLTITSGTKTTTIGSNAIISLVDTSTGFLSGGALSIQSGSEYSQFSARGMGVGGSIFIGNDGSNNIYIQGGATTGIRLSPNAGLGSTTYNVQVEGHLNSTYSLSTAQYTADETSTADGTHISGGRIVARRITTPLFLHRTDGGVGPLRATTFYSGGVFAGGINMYTNQAAQFVNPSDYRLKENIQDYNNASEIVKKARLRKFNFKNDLSTEIVGFIAHEYAEVNPNFVIGEKDAVDENGDPIYQEMMMGSITPYLIGALKESILKIEQLEARLDALEG